MLGFVRALAVIFVWVAGCSPAPQHRDVTQENWYRQSVTELAAMNHQAEDSFRAGKTDEAAAIIQKAQPIQKKILDVSHPTIEAAEAASDLDDLYGRMLLSNRHYAWAQMMFQKNLSRWKHWDPPSEESARRVKQAQSEIAECSRKMEQ